MIEKLFEKAMWQTRFLVILAVVFGLLGAIVLFVVASLDIWNVTKYTFDTIITNAHPKNFHEDIVSGIIGAVDLYLIAVVMLIFLLEFMNYLSLQLIILNQQKKTQKYCQ